MLRPELFEPSPLSPRLVEVRRVEPRFEGRAEPRPLAVDDREPRVIAVPPIPDTGLPEGPLVDEAQPLRRTPRRRVEAVAFPLVPPVAELVEDAPHHQVHRFGRR